MLAHESDGPPPAVGPYVLCNLLSGVPVSADSTSKNATDITCVEYWNGNLYVGTSAAEILHYVLIPADPGDPFQKPSFILATRLRPEHESQNGPAKILPGVQQIVVLPAVGKACILCNFTLTFYVLPELSPAFGGAYKLPKCTWVGGVDLDELEEDTDSEGVVLMMCLEERIRLVRIGERAKGIRPIDLPRCLAVARRGSIACVANESSYSLIDVVERQAIPLFDISTSSKEGTSYEVPEVVQQSPGSPASTASGSYEKEDVPNKSAGDAPPEEHKDPKSQSDDASAEKIEPTYNSEESSASCPQRTASLVTSEPRNQEGENVSPSGNDTRESRTPEVAQKSGTKAPEIIQGNRLRPHVLTPTPNEFLLTTGTSVTEAGVGIFVNLDGDVVRGTIEFSTYPEAVALDGKVLDTSTQTTSTQGSENEFVLAIVKRVQNNSIVKGIEIQHWDLETNETNNKHWLQVEHQSSSDKDIPPVGLRSTESAGTIPMTDVTERLRLKQYNIGQHLNEAYKLTQNETTTSRERAESEFVNRISLSESHILVWCRDTIWWAVRSSIATTMDSQLDQALTPASRVQEGLVDRSVVGNIMKSLHGSEQQTELDFLSVKYIRQKASLSLFADLARSTGAGFTVHERERELTLEALIEGEIDPRIILGMVPVLRLEIVHSQEGIWLQGGLLSALDRIFPSLDLQAHVGHNDPYAESLFPLVKHYLYFWRRKKGFGSVADESDVFLTVDGALLHLLLILDSKSPRGPATKGSIRAELGSLLDAGVNCFERGVQLLEDYQRPYMLSRLYQSQRNYSRVLETWQRIIEGGPDKGGEFEDGEEKIRKYLSERRDRHLVEQYGSWLAARNPKVGVRVFTDRKNHVKFDPKEVVPILKERAPNAVQDFLENLVFGNNQPEYADDLIGYYLDSVLEELETSETSRISLLSSYEAYRALRPPKPTYSQFAADNALDAGWQRNRLRLLQLLGGSHGAASQYNLSEILRRIEPHKQELVPETIILSGREGRHDEAIELLVHSLGDFDTAVTYCVRGGSSTYSPLSGQQRQNTLPSRKQQIELFTSLLQEFFRIQDLNDRVTQTSELLDRFAGMFDATQVLSLVPDSWSVDLLSGFLESALRQLVTERSESAVARALTSSENLTTNAEIVEKVDALGPQVEEVG